MHFPAGKRQVQNFKRLRLRTSEGLISIND
jgi:hypothetical protein